MSQTLKFLIGNFKGNFSRSSFAKCDFHGCTFRESILKKVEFESCRFDNCKIRDSNLDKVDFDDTNVNSCQFKRISLLAGSFTDCKIIESDFEEINSYDACAIIVDSQIFKYNRLTDLKGDFSFNKLLKFLK